MTKTRAFESDTKPSLFPDKPAKIAQPFSGKQTQFPNSENHYNYLQRRDLQRFLPPKPQKKQTQNKPNSKPIKANFKTEIYPDFQAPHVSKGTKANPIQTQFTPQPNICLYRGIMI
ncbi:MAG TPA: hypothetical protein ENH94_04095 [Phycisphaerales bacterium]|nr:hypothetical protein [Phycisphaerales bacterium]